MPVSGRGEDSEEEQVFQSPEWDSSKPGEDTGASPQLRRSTRKRKSTAGDDSLRASGSKKKKEMPKVGRSPPRGQAQAQDQGQAQAFEAMLLAMEGRLSAKIEKASEASREAAHQAKLNSEGLELLESRVDANETCLMDALRESETRIMETVQSKIQDLVQEHVKVMVSAQLHAAGFDQDLTASDLTVRNSVIQTPSTSYATAAAASPMPSKPRDVLSKADKQENNFLVARRSLRLWPIPGGKKESLEGFLKEKLRMEPSFIREELGQVVLSKPKEPRNKNKDEYIVTFESKQVRDEVKSKAANLANHRETAGMRLHVPDHLQKDFRTLMNLSYDLKQKHPALKRNVKFDEDDGGLFMDLKLSDESEWKRVKPSHAAAANKRRKNKTRTLEEDELKELLGGGEEEDSE